MDVLGCPIPDDCWVDIENEIWARPDPDGVRIALGVLASQAAFAGRYVSVRFRDLEGVVDRGRSLATLESLRTTVPFRIPMTGRVVERNAALAVRPKLLNDSPYDHGWVARIIPTDPGDLARLLARPAQIREVLESRIRERRITCYPAAPDVEIYGIGSECSATLAKLDEDLTHRDAGEIVLVVTDDPTSPAEFARWSDRTGHTLLYHRREGNLYHFLVRKEAEPHPRIRGAVTGEMPSG